MDSSHFEPLLCENKHIILTAVSPESINHAMHNDLQDIIIIPERSFEISAPDTDISAAYNIQESFAINNKLLLNSIMNLCYMN
jgi:hypothetical protein